ncbi:unnamed protein product, partial [Cladocopium goreaui]
SAGRLSPEEWLPQDFSKGENQLEQMLSELRKHRNWMPRNRRKARRKRKRRARWSFKVAQAMPKMGRCQGFTLGLTTDYKLGARGAPVVSKATRAHPALTLALCRGCRAACPDFHFTSIQVNLNTKYGMHTDGYDAGPSRMIALGNFSEGQLWLHDGRKNRWSTWTAIRFGALAFRYLGLVNVQNTWIAFDGREFHLTEDWQGPERYSLVFFTNHLWDQLPAEAQRQLTNLGFQWPKEANVFRQAATGRTAELEALPAAVAAAPQAPPKNPRAREVRLARHVGPGAEGYEHLTSQSESEDVLYGE